MPAALEQIAKNAMDLSPRQKLALAEFLMECVEGAGDLTDEVAWESEIRDRIRTIDEGGGIGISHEEVMRAAAEHLQQTPSTNDGSKEEK